MSGRFRFELILIFPELLIQLLLVDFFAQVQFVFQKTLVSYVENMALNITSKHLLFV